MIGATQAIASKSPSLGDKSVRSGRTRAALLLGSCSGLRTFTAPAMLAIRTPVGSRTTRSMIAAAAVGELIADKLPMTPARVTPPALLARIASGAIVGYGVCGATGARTGALAAAASTVIAYNARAALGSAAAIPDALLGLAEDAFAVSLAVIATNS
jgi:uncharacterized membrane protein